MEKLLLGRGIEKTPGCLTSGRGHFRASAGEHAHDVAKNSPNIKWRGSGGGFYQEPESVRLCEEERIIWSYSRLSFPSGSLLIYPLGLCVNVQVHLDGISSAVASAVINYLGYLAQGRHMWQFW